jgi:hypothetical protein
MMMLLFLLQDTDSEEKQSGFVLTPDFEHSSRAPYIFVSH